MRALNRLFNLRSIKVRLGIVLFITTAVPIILIGYISYHWIYIVQTDKIEKDIQNKIIQEKNELDQRLTDITSVSQLLSVEGGIGRNVVKYIYSRDELEKTILYNDITQSISNVNFANPNLGVMFFYAPFYNDPILFANAKLANNVHFENLPLFYRKKLLSYYGPYESMNNQDHNLVIAVVRKMDDGVGHTIFAYIETKLTGLDDIFLYSSKTPSYHILVNPNGNVVYSNMNVIKFGKRFQTPEGYKAFSAESDLHWKLYELVPLSEYNGEIHKWIVQFFLFSCLSLVVGVILALFIWKMIYGPIRTINKEITRFGDDQSLEPVVMTGLVEFERVLDNFHSMRKRIINLIIEVKEKEIRKGQLEVEKLLVQINPHFLHNTLNTIQWLARMQGQMNIVQLVSVFTRVLHYNLGKKSIIVNVWEEVEAIRDYFELQNIRYDHVFKVTLDIDPEALHIPIPRFILQPLVENSLYHGFEEGEGVIRVVIAKEESDMLLLQVQDNGTGIPEERLKKLFEHEDLLHKSGLGIGLQYVKKMLEVYYGGSARLEITSFMGKGTTVSIYLPVKLKGSTES